ncbi:thioredoxin family protein [uncultured Croceitalea sp.]|uniref:thioredoxin family protein n=1 Tax=uncultured Croceitalea sp. TaxID=1798908 RepID=UPI0033065E2C
MRIVTLIALLAASSILMANDKGIKWYEATKGVTFEAVKAKAKAENKKIFLDFYTVWCGPCKSMDKRVFSNESVGNYFNDRFINYKIDAEKGIGKALVKTFEVKGYPTYIFMDADGTVINKTVGTQGIESVSAMLDHTATIYENKKFKTLEELQAEYEAGNRDVSFLKKYIDKYQQEKPKAVLSKLGLDLAQALEKEGGLEDKTNELKILFGKWSRPKDTVYQYIAANRNKFPTFKTKEKIVNFIFFSLLNHSRYPIRGVHKKAAHRQIVKDFPKYGSAGIQYFELKQTYRGGPLDNEYYEEFFSIVNNNALSPSLDLGLLWDMIKTPNIDSKYFELVLPVAKEQRNSINEGFDLFVYAYCLYKAGKKEAALKVIADNRKTIDEGIKNAKKIQSNSMTKGITEMEQGKTLTPFRFW